MQKYQDTITGREWHFEQGVDISTLPNTPKTLSSTIVPRPSGAYSWMNGGWVSDLTKVKADKISQLTASYASAIQQPVTYMGTLFQADDASQVVLTKVLVAGSVQAGFFWLDTNNVKVIMDYAQLQGLATAMLTQGQAAFVKLQTLKTQVRLATAVITVNSVVW